MRIRLIVSVLSATLLLAVELSPAHAKTDPALCKEDNTRVSIPHDLPITVCFDDKQLVIKNDTGTPVRVNVSGDSVGLVSHASPGPEIASAIVDLISDDGILAPGFKGVVPVGDDFTKISFADAGPKAGVAYVYSKVLVDVLPAGLFTGTYSALAELVTSLVDAQEQFDYCYNTRRNFGKMGCAGEFSWKAYLAFKKADLQLSVTVLAEILGVIVSLATAVPGAVVSTYNRVKFVDQLAGGPAAVEVRARSNAPAIIKVEPLPPRDPIQVGGSHPPAPARANPKLTISGSCTTVGGSLGSSSSGFTPGGTATITVVRPDGSPYPETGYVRTSRVNGGSITWTWDCVGDPAGTWSTFAVDNTTGAKTPTATFTIGSPPVATPTPTTAPPTTPPETTTTTTAPVAERDRRVVVTVSNLVTNGSQMREDPNGPVVLQTETRPYCGSACLIAGTERGTGQTYDAAVCQVVGERITNGNDADPVDDQNPGRYESRLWLGVQLADGRFGYVNETWIDPSQRGGLGLRGC